jgi:hypothetical protein
VHVAGSFPNFFGELPLNLASQRPAPARGKTAGSPGPTSRLKGPAGTAVSGPETGPSLSPQQQLLIALLQTGSGMQVRAEVLGDGLESDLLNNEQSRGWLLEDMETVNEQRSFRDPQ